MRTIFKIVLAFILPIAMVSCAESYQPAAPEKIEPPSPPDKFTELHHYIRPTKPIRIPDTMAILPRPAFLETPSDTITTLPQDSTINEE
jgi:hypothetical protein